MPSTDQQLTAARYKIDDLLRMVREGKIRIPHFQRGLRWGGTDVERLFDSIYRGFPVGTLLFWIRPAERETVRLGPVEITAPSLPEAFWVVDGQQRITTLAAALLPKDPVERDAVFDVYFDLEKEQFGRSDSPRTDSRLPVREAYDLQRVLAWLRSRELSSALQERAFQLADRLRNFEVPAYLVTTSDEESLRTIFDRSNTFGKAMSRAEVFQALNSSERGAPDDFASLSESLASAGFGTIQGNTLLYAVLATRGVDVTREFRGEFLDDDDRRHSFEETRAALLRTIAFLRDHADVPHLSLVPYQHQTIGLVRFFARHPSPEPQHLVLLRRWFWQASELGPIAKLGNTGTLRATTTAIVGIDPYKDVVSLLKLTDASPPDFGIGSYRWTSADTRVAVSALASRHPIGLEEGEIDVTAAIEQGGREALRVLVHNANSPLAATIANRVFVSVDDRLSEDEWISQLRTETSETLESLALTPRLVGQLETGQIQKFLGERAILITESVQRFLSARTERTLPVRPPIAHLVHD